MAENMSTVIGKDSIFTGKVEVSNSLRVDGSVKGEIVSKETVVIGPTGRLEGDLTSKCSIIAGQVIGNVTAEDKVELQAKALLQGDLKTRGLVIEQGAVFQGACRMQAENVVSERKPVTVEA